MAEDSIEDDGSEQWEEVNRTTGFHVSRGDTTAEAWDVRMVVKALKDEELD